MKEKFCVIRLVPIAIQEVESPSGLSLPATGFSGLVTQTKEKGVSSALCSAIDWRPTRAQNRSLSYRLVIFHNDTAEATVSVLFSLLRRLP